MDNEWKKEFDRLWPTEQFTERALTIEEMEKRKTYYTKELVGMKSFIESLLASQKEKLAEEVRGMKRLRKPTHGTCCTCQTCGGYNDHECDCPRNEIIEEVAVFLSTKQQ